MWVEIIAGFCLAWYVFIAIVCLIGYIQLYWLCRSISKKIVRQTDACQVQTIFYCPQQAGVFQATDRSSTSCHRHSSGQGSRTVPVRMSGCDLPPRLPGGKADGPPLHCLSR